MEQQRAGRVPEQERVESLVTDFAAQPPGTPTPDGRDVGDRPRSRVRFDVVPAPAGT